MHDHRYLEAHVYLPHCMCCQWQNIFWVCMQNTRGLQLNQFTKLGLDPLGCSVNMEALAHYSETRGAKEHCTWSIKWFTPLSMSTRTLAYAVLQQRAPIRVLQYIGAFSSVMAVCQGEPHSGFLRGSHYYPFHMDRQPGWTWVDKTRVRPDLNLVSICFCSHNSNFSTHCIIVSRWRWKSVFLSCGCAWCTQYVTGLIHSPTLSAKLQSAFRSNSVILPFYSLSYLITGFDSTSYQGRIQVVHLGVTRVWLAYISTCEWINPGLTLVNGSMWKGYIIHPNWLGSESVLLLFFVLSTYICEAAVLCDILEWMLCIT